MVEMRRLEIFRAAATLRFGFEGIEAEALTFRLTPRKIYPNVGSACATKLAKSFRPAGHQDSPDGAQGSSVFTMNLTNRGKEVD